MPISRTRKDYVQSAIVLLVIAASAVVGVYFTNPLKIRTNAGTKLLGINFPNFQGIVMRQPRMTMAFIIAVILLVTAFIFIARPALSFFSRPIAWGTVIISGLGLISIGFFNDAGKGSSWFRFFVLCLVFTGGLTIMTEAMIFYRRFFHNRPFRFNIMHRIAFSLVCAVIAGAMSCAYFHYALTDGIFLDYGPKTTVAPPSAELPTDLPFPSDTSGVTTVPLDTAPVPSS